VRASRMACDAPLEPIGYMGWAASPSSVPRPNVQRGTGSRSTIGNTNVRGAALIMAGTCARARPRD
jgi:hypothetical protein